MEEKPTGLEYVKGSPVNFDETWGNGSTVFVLEMWATWCGPCRTSIPHLTEVAKRFESKGVVFIGITSEAAQPVQQFVDQMGPKMDYRVAIDKDKSVNTNYMSKYSVRGIPHAFIIGRDGKMQWHGHPMEPDFEAQLEAAANVQSKPKVDYSTLSEQDLQNVPVKDLKHFLQSKGIDYSGAVEKSDLIKIIKSSL